MSFQWKKGQKCEVWSTSKHRWIEGQVVGIFTDGEGKWIKIKYGRTTQEFPAESSEIRPFDGEKEKESYRKWKVGALCELYVRERAMWCPGEVISVFADDHGSVIRVKYGQRVRDIPIEHIDRDIREPGVSVVTSPIVSDRDVDRLKGIMLKHQETVPVLTRILSLSRSLSDEIKDDDEPHSFVS